MGHYYYFDFHSPSYLTIARPPPTLSQCEHVRVHDMEVFPHYSDQWKIAVFLIMECARLPVVQNSNSSSRLGRPLLTLRRHISFLVSEFKYNTAPSSRNTDKVSDQGPHTTFGDRPRLYSQK
ncbi:hypothetical protein J4Q44_G00143310 [Coregonus suidteri]|uniref:Uncharacterized protein n=1 Tax=Coregonus suidteri TaxID=861788 RepID=A0AAN8LUX1_9TELE